MPICSLKTLRINMAKSNNVVLVIAPHPDDETLGLGGTLLKHKAEGDAIYWLIATNIWEDGNYSDAFKKKRKKIIEKVSAAYGVAERIELPYRATALDTYPFGDIIAHISGVVQQYKPNILYIPHHSDVHSDHRLVFQSAVSCSKAFRFPSIRQVLMYETVSETDLAPPLVCQTFAPNYFVDISQYFQRKVSIMELYEGELGVHPFPRSKESLRALAVLRGSVANVRFAEGFMLLRGLF